ncbi:hypothetical protein [Vulgatibacter sp.]|uniref:hypothetical protein n=1 Tax=Vulgatibacter sp. TaxID=1971226 RepID=UPI0035648C1C
MTDSQRSKQVFRAILLQGFYLAVLYASLGLVLELLHQRLPGPVYERAAGAIYGLPMRLIIELGLQGELIGAVAQGRLPGWLAGAVVPAVGVVVILCASVLIASAFRFTASVFALRQS